MGPNDKTIRHCPYCHERLYHLKEGMCKCAGCRRKFSPRKVARELDLIALFCRGETAHAAAETLQTGYQGVIARYTRFRLLAASHLEAVYEARRNDICEFEEYIYLEASKRADRRNIFDAHNFITFDYGGRVYNLMMPTLHRFKRDFLDDGLDELYYEEFAKFLRIHRIAKLQRNKNTITEFWEFFESYITRFKGVRPENFPAYLKEAEFKFNYTASQQRDILERAWFRLA